MHPSNFANLKCKPSTRICREKTVIIGDVTIGADCVIHPTTTIIAKKGPIIIGDHNLLEERVEIINNSERPMLIGDHNVFEVDSRCEATHVGDNNILEIKSVIGSNIQLTNNCVIGAGCDLSESPSLGNVTKSHVEVLAPNTVIWGHELKRKIITDLPANSHSSQLDFLRKILPNYQKMWMPGSQANIVQPTGDR